MKLKYISTLLIASTMLFSCSKDDAEETGNTYNVPETYAFTDADGNSTVSYSGQTERLSQLSQIKAYMETKNDGSSVVTASVLKTMYSNNEASSESEQNANGNFENTSSKQLKSKTASDAQSIVEGWMDDFEVSNTLVQRYSNQNYIVINDKGHELVQFVEKGLMGAVFFFQAGDDYLAGISQDDNTTILDGKNYTQAQHHFDEAFGYFGAPVDYPASDGSFHAKYAAAQGLDATIMNAFIKGRAALANNDSEEANAQIVIIRENWEKAIALTAIEYLGKARGSINESVLGDYYHSLSEAYAFIWSLHFSSEAKISDSEVSAILLSIDDFTTATAQDLKSIEDQLSAIYN